MNSAAKIYAFALLVTFFSAYVFGIKKRCGEISIRGYLEFPGLFRHFYEGVKRGGWRSLLSPDMLAGLLYILLLAWLILVATFWLLVEAFGGGTPVPSSALEL